MISYINYYDNGYGEEMTGYMTIANPVSTKGVPKN